MSIPPAEARPKLHAIVSAGARMASSLKSTSPKNCIVMPPRMSLRSRVLNHRSPEARHEASKPNRSEFYIREIAPALPLRPMLKSYSAVLAISNSLNQIAFELQNLSHIQSQRTSAEQLALAIGSAVKKSEEIQPVIAAPVPDPRPTFPVDVYQRLGFNLLLDPSSIVDHCVIETGTWEPEQLAYFAQLIERLRGRPRLVFFDIGSYWGLYSLITQRTKAFSEIRAFEADKCNFGQLQSNLFLNNALHAVRALNMAVSDQVATLTFWDSRTHPDGNRAGVGIIDNSGERQGYPVNADTIDNLTTESGSCILMKIDVEGHEEFVLRGMQRTVATNKVVMQIEVYEAQHDRVFSEVEKLGLRCFHTIYPDYYLTNMTIEELGI